MRIWATKGRSNSHVPPSSVGGGINRVCSAGSAVAGELGHLHAGGSSDKHQAMLVTPQLLGARAEEESRLGIRGQPSFLEVPAGGLPATICSSYNFQTQIARRRLQHRQGQPLSTDRWPAGASREKGWWPRVLTSPMGLAFEDRPACTGLL